MGGSARVLLAVGAVVLIGAPTLRTDSVGATTPAAAPQAPVVPCTVDPISFGPCGSRGTASLVHTLFDLDPSEQGSGTLVCNYTGAAVLTMDGGRWRVAYEGENWHQLSGSAFVCGGGTGGNAMAAGSYEIDPLRITVDGIGDCPEDTVGFDGRTLSGTTHGFCGESDVYTFAVSLADAVPATVPASAVATAPTVQSAGETAAPPTAPGAAAAPDPGAAVSADATIGERAGPEPDGSGSRVATAAILVAAALACAVAAALLARSLGRSPAVPPAQREPAGDGGAVAAPADEPGRTDDTDDDEHEVLLELTHPAGHSALVFSTGWLFGARAIADPHGPDRADISRRVHWSGSGSFRPAVGDQSRPTFASEGLNTIELSVTHQGATTTRSFTVDAVSPRGYAFVGCNAEAPADSHGGCPACPHAVIGPITTGSSTVLVNGRPAARFGDRGTHAACCGPNQFEIPYQPTLEPRVLIDGRPAAKKGDETAHCGGAGTIVDGAP